MVETLENVVLLWLGLKIRFEENLLRHLSVVIDLNHVRSNEILLVWPKCMVLGI